MKLHYLIILLLLLVSTNQLYAVDLPEVIENTIYSDNIKTVVMYRDGWKISNPIINLNSDQALILSFDDLNNERSDYYYTIYHCTRDWRISGLAQQEYLDSYVDFPLTDYEYSINTKIGFVNYMLRIPNENVPIRFSGNYALVVFDRNNPNLPILTWRFYVVEPKISIAARIHRATHDPSNGENQEVDFVIDKGNFPIQDPVSDIKVVITQNNRTDNAISDLKPQYVNGNILEYDYNFENTFKGENEFRFFAIRGIKYEGEGVAEISFHNPVYHATLLPHELRVQDRYSYFQEMNGNFSIETYSSDYPEIEADYMFVHFTLKMPQPLLGGGVYVFGKLSNWQCLKQNEMVWNFEQNQYELTMLLKQGYYNFAYAYKDYKQPIVKMYNIEGSHFETENDYQIFVYYGRITDRYDRLIGYQLFNSQTSRSSID